MLSLRSSARLCRLLALLTCAGMGGQLAYASPPDQAGLASQAPSVGQAHKQLAPRQPLHALTGHSASKIQVGLRQPGPPNIFIPAPVIPEGLVSPDARASLHSEIAFVQDLESSTVLYQKNAAQVRPVASITKLMTALIVAESNLPLDEQLRITEADIDHLRNSGSRLSVGTQLSRGEMLHLALMSSENRAANALGRHYPGGLPAFVRAMNDKARALGMRDTQFVEPTGLSAENVSSPRDLVKLLRAVTKHPIIKKYSTDDTHQVRVGKGRQLVYNNTNRLVKNDNWTIQVSKTGFINEAGQCLVMVTRIDGRDLAIVLLNAQGRYSRIGDAVRVRQFVEKEVNIAML